jgi:hypothetical protein
MEHVAWHTDQIPSFSVVTAGSRRKIAFERFPVPSPFPIKNTDIFDRERE